MQHDEIILTKSSKRQKEEELRRLKIVELPAIRQSVQTAREYGDLSENFEYQAARQAQAILNGRIAELEALLMKARVVEDDAAAGSTVVTIGTRLTLRSVDDPEDEFMVTITDAATANGDDKISSLSPVGKAVMNRSKGDRVQVHLPHGVAEFEIAEIHA